MRLPAPYRLTAPRALVRLAATRSARMRTAIGFAVTLGAMSGGVALVALTSRVPATAAVPVLPTHRVGPPAAGDRGGAARHGPLTVAWVGDITPGSSYGLPPGQGDALFAGVRPFLRRPDLTLGNLEGTLGTGGTSKCPPQARDCFAFQAPPGNAEALRRAGFDGVNVANNHADDYGAQGRYETTAALARAGIGATGTPDYVRLFHRRGRRVGVVGFASYAWSAPLNDPAAVRALVGQAAREADIVVVLFHGGAEGADRTHVPQGREYAFGEDRGDLRAFAHEAVDAGADLVLGSGPHVLRGMECYRHRLVAYSLGNFAGVHTFALDGVLGLSGILDAKLGPDGRFAGGRLTSVRLVGAGTPEPDPAAGGARLVSQLSAADFGSAGVRMTPAGRLRGC